MKKLFAIGAVGAIVAATLAVRPPVTSSSAIESGGFSVELVRDGQVVASEYAKNALFDEGESALLDCFYRGVSGGFCPTAFSMHLLSTAAGGPCPTLPAESTTWATLSSNELSGGTAGGYAAVPLSRNSTDWPTLTTVGSGTGGCTETSCAQVSSAQKTITATGNWSATARYIAISATINSVEKVISVACLSADRTLLSGDQLNLTFKQAMQ